jgi:hypothetical protein
MLNEHKNQKIKALIELHQTQMLHSSTKNIYDLYATEATVVAFFGMIQVSYSEHQMQQQTHKKRQEGNQGSIKKKCAGLQNIIYFIARDYHVFWNFQRIKIWSRL